MVDRKPAGSLSRQRIWRTAALLLTIVGVALSVLGSCSSTAGPPQPGPDADGIIAAGTMVAPANSAPPDAVRPATRESRRDSTPPPPASATTSAPSPVGRSSAGSPGGPATTSTGGIARPTSTIVVPSFHPVVTGPVLAPARPVSISIPALNVGSPMLALGLLSDGTVQTPPLDADSKAGWYTGSPTPGAQGPSIILGHVDSKAYGPGIFYNLGKLRPGDHIDIARADGTTAIFHVDGVRSYPKNSFPTEQIYGDLDRAGLRLITCGGTFDPHSGSYESNVIAFASLASVRRS